jgi:hypothetical protein
MGRPYWHLKEHRFRPIGTRWNSHLLLGFGDFVLMSRFVLAFFSPLAKKRTGKNTTEQTAHLRKGRQKSKCVLHGACFFYRVF